MKLENNTPYHAQLFRGSVDERKLFGSVVARLTYDIVGDRLRLAAEQAWTVSPGPWDSEHGPLPGDDLFYRGGVDLLVFGAARPTGGRAASRVDVDIRLGAGFRARLAVFGDRRWQRVGGRLVPGPPQAFKAMPLTLAHAFGGQIEWDKLAVPFVDNPAGKGFHADEASAEGGALPNIEDPAALVQRWDDRPEPVGTGAPGQSFGPRLRRSVVFDDDGNLQTLRPSFFNAAFPQMIAPGARPGERLSIVGVREDGPLVFHLPDPGLRVRLEFGEEQAERAPAIDQIGVEPDRMRVFVSYRYPFRYVLNPLQRRRCELLTAR